MKKFILVLMVLLFAAPALATVHITCTADGNTVTVEYDATSEANFVRALALDIILDNDAKILSMTAFDPNYPIYPGSIDINGTTGLVDANGSAICDSAKYDGTYPGPPDSNAATVEMGSLEDVPVKSGVLFEFVVDADCTVAIAENQIRAGVVMDGGGSPDVNCPGCTVTLACDFESCTYWALGDLNGDGWVSGDDVIPIANNYGAAAVGPLVQIDVNKDGWISGDDVIPIANNYGAGDGVACCPYSP